MARSTLSTLRAALEFNIKPFRTTTTTSQHGDETKTEPFHKGARIYEEEGKSGEHA
jgi:hypothetical protein